MLKDPTDRIMRAASLTLAIEQELIMTATLTSITSAQQLKQAYASGQRSFAGAQLAGLELTGLDLSEVDLSGANLSGADLREANLSRANLSQANLQGAKLRRTNLVGATLKGADLQRANMYRTKLIRADLTGANLARADLRIGADLRGAAITDTTFRGALYDEYTKFPPDFDPTAMGM